MKIVLVEDNRGFGERLYTDLSRFGSSVWWILSEEEFRNSFDQICKDTPDVFVIDTMLRWAYPRPGSVEIPSDAKDLYTAGVRCAQSLYECEITARLPVILYTVFDEAQLREKMHGAFPPNVSYLQKTSETAGLIDTVRDAVARATATRPADRTAVSS